MIGLDGLAGRRSGHFLNTTPSIDGGSAWASTGFQGYKSSLPPRNGRDADGRWQHVTSVVSWPETGHHGFANPQWGKILILPPQQDFGSVLSDRDFSFEVWSTFRDRPQTLASLTQSGPGGLSILDAWGEPLTYQPGQSRIYPSSLPGSGDPTINSVATFSFTGLSPVIYRALGSRVAVFWPAMDWSEPFREKPQWKTSILPGYSTAEQRIQLRQLPRWQASFRIVSLTDRQTAMLEAQLHAMQPTIWGVPWWPETSYLSSQAPQGSILLQVDTTNRPTFFAGGLVLLWLDAFTWAAEPIQDLDAGSITLGLALARTWPAGTKVVPLRKGTMATELPLGRPTIWVSAATFTFTCEASA